MNRFTSGEWVVVDGTLRVQYVRTLEDGRMVVETGHGSLVVEAERVIPLA